MGKVLYAKAFGEADKDHHVKNTLDTKYNIGSIGKIFTGIAIMQLAEQGKIDVNDPVIKHLHDFPFGEKIQIRHLLSHTGGTFNYFAYPDFLSKLSSIQTVNDALALIYEQELKFNTPGEKFFYSNSGIIILGAIIEKVTGRKFPDYIKENILLPAGMFDTGYHFLDAVVENRASGYDKNSFGKFKRNIYTVPLANADGGIETTVKDLLKLDQAMYGEKLLSQASFNKMFTENLDKYGYCMRVDERHGNKVVGHSGGAPGVSAQFLRFLKDKYVLIVLSNYNSVAKKVANTIEAILFNEEYELPKIPVTEFLYKEIQKNGIAQVVDNASDILQKNGYSIKNSIPLAVLGFDLLETHENAMAMEIFKLNIAMFPDQALPYDFLGDAYMALDEKTTAKNYYIKALEIDPQSVQTKQKLEKMAENIK